MYSANGDPDLSKGETFISAFETYRKIGAINEPV